MRFVGIARDKDIAIGAPVPPSSEVPRLARGRAHAGYGRITLISYDRVVSITEPRGTKEITRGKTAHGGLKVPPNAPDGLVAFIKPIV